MWAHRVFLLRPVYRGFSGNLRATGGGHARTLTSIIADQAQWIEKLKHELFRLRRWQFGTKAERLPEGQQIFDFYGTLEDDRKKAEEEAASGPPPPRAPRQGHGRRVIPPELPRRQVIHDVPESDRKCDECGETMVEFGRDVSEQLEYQPCQIYVIQNVYPKYACKKKACEMGSVAQAPAETSPVGRGLAGPGLMAHVMVSKYDDHLPLYRQSEIFARQGLELPRSTLGLWMAESVGLLRPLVGAMKADILQSKVIRTDDTPVRVLDPGAGRTHQGRFWAYLGDRAHRQVVFEFTMTREQKWAKAFLGNYAGYLQADAFKGYDQLFLGGLIIEVACWAHGRRYFFDAQETDRERALWALGQIGLLYDIEREAKERALKPDEVRDLRQERATPILRRIRDWLEREAPRVLPKSPIGQAIHYALSQWKALQVYLEDGNLSIDNNDVENILRGVAIGRKNWLFLGSEGGGEWAATIYSLIESCKMHGVNPWLYLKDVLVRVSTHPSSRILELTPRLWKPPPDSS
jgi:transposase